MMEVSGVCSVSNQRKHSDEKKAIDQVSETVDGLVSKRPGGRKETN
jgi:hypothetical protein